MKKITRCLMMVLMALLYAVTYELFVFPNKFAPAGLNGIATIVQHLFRFSVGYFSLLVNIPLALLVYKKVSRDLAVYSMIQVVTFSLALLLLDKYPILDRFAYATDNGTSTILGPLTAGIINGFCYSTVLRFGGTTGGMDFIAALIRRRRPDMDLMWISFCLNAVVAALSYFVYDFQVEPVLLCVIYCFLTSAVGGQIVKAGKSAIKFEIVTHAPAALSSEILRKLGHGVTLLDGRGMYSGKETSVLLCVINRNQVVDLERIIRRYPGTFAYLSPVGEVVGNFRKIRSHPLDDPDHSGKD